MSTPLYERLMALAIDLSFDAYRVSGDQMRGDPAIEAFTERLAEMATECERDYVPATAEGDFPTNAQGVALARVMRTVMRDDRYEADPARASARVHRGGFGCGPNYLTWQLGDDYHGGIDREGRVST